MLLRLFNNRGKQIGNHNDCVTSRQKTVLWTLLKLALRSGITVASEVYPRRGYCWLKTFPNTPQDDLKYSRLCNFWWSTRGPHINQTKISIKVWITVYILTCADVFVGKIGRVVIFNNLNGAQYDKKKLMRWKIKGPRSGRLCGLLAHWLKWKPAPLI